MRRITGAVLALMLCASCAGGGQGGRGSGGQLPTPTVPTRATSGPTDIFGLRLDISSPNWRVVDESTTGSFQLEYVSSEHPCEQGRCPVLQIFTNLHELYQLIVQDDQIKGEPDDCPRGASAFKPAEPRGERSVGGETAQHYVSPWCPTFTHNPGVPERERRSWLLPERRRLIIEIEAPDGSGIPDLDNLLKSASWS